MTLENIVAGVDQFLLRQYTRVACAWERTGHSKYVLTDILDYSTAFSVMFYNACVPESRTWNAGAQLYMAGRNGYYTMYEKREEQEGQDGAVAVDRDVQASKAINRSLRLPIMACSLGPLIYQGYEVAAGLATGDAGRTAAGAQGFASWLPSSAPWFAISSSMYLRASDRRLLPQRSWLKDAYRALKKRVGSISLPSPVPEPDLAPIPVRYGPSVQA